MENDKKLEEIEPVEADDFQGPREKWDRRRDESKRAHSAFVLYRDSTERRLIDVAAKLNCSVQNIGRWSSRYMWRERCWAWDEQQDRLQQAQEARDRSAARKRHLAISHEMQSIAVYALSELKKKVVAGTPLDMSPAEIEGMLAEAIKIERAVLGVEKDRRQFTQIQVIVSGYESEKQYDNALRQQGGLPLLDGEDGEGKERPCEEWLDQEVKYEQ